MVQIVSIFSPLVFNYDFCSFFSTWLIFTTICISCESLEKSMAVVKIYPSQRQKREKKHPGTTWKNKSA